MVKKAEKITKKIVTIYTNSVGEEMIRICLDNSQTNKEKPNEFRTFRNSLITGIPAIINDVTYASVITSTGKHMLKPPRKGLTLIVLPHNISHYYIEDYQEHEA